MPAATVIGALRQFLPIYLQNAPPLPEATHRAIWAITHCRTPTLGGHLYACHHCSTTHYAYHSCNHRACPQCGKAATAEWVQRELEKRINAPYFMVTFTLPDELRPLFFVPGAGIQAQGQIARVKNANFLLPRPAIQQAFAYHFGQELKSRGWTVPPTVWHKSWGVDISPFGDRAENAIKYLGTYVSRSAIADSRLLHYNQESVTFSYKDRRDHDRIKIDTIPGLEFITRYLRHVLPRGLRSVRYYGFCHPAAKAKRERIAFHTGRALWFGTTSKDHPSPSSHLPPSTPTCPSCQEPMARVGAFAPVRYLLSTDHCYGSPSRAPPPVARS